MKIGRILALALVLLGASAPQAAALPPCDCNYCQANPLVWCEGPTRCRDYYNSSICSP